MKANCHNQVTHRNQFNSQNSPKNGEGARIWSENIP